MPLNGEYEASPRDYVRRQVEEYESSGGTSGSIMRGLPIIILTTVGARSGKLRKTPLMRVEHDGRYAVVASLGGPRSIPSGTTTCGPIPRSSCRTARPAATTWPAN